MQKNKVIDISSYKPNRNEWIFVDTNILLLTYYAKYDKCSCTKLLKNKDKYDTFLKITRNRGARLLTTRLNVTEFLHRILVNEIWDLFRIKIDDKGKLALLRNSNDSRKETIKDSINDYLTAIEGSFEIVDSLVNKAAADKCVVNSENLVGTSDTLIVKAMHDSNHQRILTDDQDYVCIQGVTVLTANNTIIDNADEEKRLI